MKITVYRAKLNVKKTKEQVIETFDSSTLNEEKIQGWIEAYEKIDGCEVFVIKSWTGDGYSLAGWQDEDDEKFREFVYQVEQDEFFGTYIGDREGFIKDWETGEYSSDGTMVFKEEELANIEGVKTLA